MRKVIYAALLVLILCFSGLAQIAQRGSMAIRGQVLDDQGNPVSGALVNAHRDGGMRGKLPSAVTDARGEFAIEVYQTGSFKVTASKLADRYPSIWNPFYYPNDDFLPRVSVNGDQAPSFVTVRMGSKAGKIAGRITDAETGEPVKNARIDFCRAEIPNYCHRVSAMRPNGEFDILVPSTPFTILVSAPGYNDWDGAEGEARQPMSLEVSSGETKTVSVTLEKLSSRRDVVKRSLLEAPKPLSPTNGAEFYHFPRSTKLEWSPVHGAASYRVELEFCNGPDTKSCPGYLFQIRGNPPLSGIKDTSYEFLFLGAQAGRWRVWAVDEKGRMGAKSDWAVFIYRM